jgi:hypothetical protein
MESRWCVGREHGRLSWRRDAFEAEGPMNKVIARFADGRMLKGLTADFFPTKDCFHVSVAMAPPGAKPVEIQTKQLKALFFVKDLEGDSEYTERKDFDPSHPPVGRRIRVEFEDGEVLVGITQGYQSGRPGFFLEPADVGSNNERCYVVSAAAHEIRFL